MKPDAHSGLNVGGHFASLSGAGCGIESIRLRHRNM
jgi:hypothetical protein